MKRLNKIFLTTIAPLTVATTASLATTSCSKQTKHKPVFFKTPSIAKTIYCVNGMELDDDLIVTLQSLQGILAQQQAQIYIFGADRKESRDIWWYVTEYDLDIKSDWTYWNNPWGLILNFKDAFNGKYILYKNAQGSYNPETKVDTRDWNKSINLSTTIAGVEHYLMINQDLEEEAKSHGLTLGMDGTNLSSHAVFEEYKDRLNNKILVNQSPYDFPLRDYAIAAKALTIYLEDETSYFRNTVTSWVEDNSPTLGWNKGELGFVASQSAENLPVLASDHCCNLSLYSGHPSVKLEQKKQKKLQADASKHYVAIVMSDGDNLQWMQDDYALESKWFGTDYSFPMTWTISPAAYDLNPEILEFMYEEMYDSDEFIAGPSGFAYANMAQYNDTRKFAKITDDYMQQCDLHYVNVLDYYDCDPSKFKDLMRRDQIQGAVWCNRDLYLSGHGAVDWINDKPIVSMREGLWDNAEVAGQDHPLTPENVAKRMNENYVADIHSINGYTIITANAWAQSGQMEGVSQLVDSLDARFEIVTLGQILELIKDNVPHQHAQPDIYAPCPDVPD